MPIASTDILYKLSAPGASAGNTTAAGAAGASLGKYVSTTVVVDATIDNIFPDVTGDENAASNVDYQCVFIHNNHSTLTLQNAILWLASEVSGGVNMALGADTVAASAVGASAVQALVIANKNTAPTGVGFSAPTTKAAGIALGSIGPGQVKAFWLRRTATNSSAVNTDGLAVRIEGDTAA